LLEPVHVSELQRALAARVQTQSQKAQSSS